MGLIDNIFGFKDTIFLKETSSLQNKYDALCKLIKEYPNNDNLKEEFFIVKKGIEGENEIKYQLSKANIGMYVLHDINLEYENLKAQIDYVVITKYFCYFIECKNLIGNIKVNDKSEFIREYMFDNKKVKKGMYSPLRQVEAQRDVYKKIWNTRLSKNPIINSIKRLFAENNFYDTHRVLVVASNRETILDTRYAPKDVKYKILKAENLVKQIQYDLNNYNKEDWTTKSDMEKWANTFLNINIEDNTNYYEYYKNKYLKDDINNKELLRNELIEFRNKRFKELNIPAYYVFNNEELELLVDNKPKTVEELKKILTPVKVNAHGKEILEIISKY